MNSECRPSHSSQYYLIMFIYIITVFFLANSKHQHQSFEENLLFVSEC